MIKVIKTFYFNIAEKEAKSIEEIDCLIEEYKNIRKISVSASVALFISFGSIFMLAITNILNTQVNVSSTVLSLFPQLAEEEIANSKFDELTDLTSTQETVSELLLFVMISIIIFVVYALLYNIFNQSRLSGFYEYKRYLLRHQEH